MRIAIIGGTFNPVHMGHLRAAEEVRDALALSRVLFIPACLPPHKGGEALIDARMRLEMLALATASNPAFEVSDIEIKRGGRSFTFDTLTELIEGAGGDIDITLIVGADSFSEITTWHRSAELFTLADFAVVPRPGFKALNIIEALPVELAPEFWYDEGQKAFKNPSGRTVSVVDAIPFDISSTGIRERVAAGRSLRYLVPDAVREYIRDKGLYGSPARS